MPERENRPGEEPVPPPLTADEVTAALAALREGTLSDETLTLLNSRSEHMLNTATEEDATDEKYVEDILEINTRSMFSLNGISIEHADAFIEDQRRRA